MEMCTILGCEGFFKTGCRYTVMEKWEVKYSICNNISLIFYKQILVRNTNSPCQQPEEIQGGRLNKLQV